MPAPILVPVILAGGSGTRLWPVSRAAFPKHLVELFGEESLLQATARRALATAPADRVITVAAAGQAVLIRRQFASIDASLLDHLLLEPVARNTAAAIALAALRAQATFGPSSVLWVCPSDHLITDSPTLLKSLDAAAAAAAEGWIVTFGITPSRPETGYGWIAAGTPLDASGPVRKVDRFIEKPDLSVARELQAAGNLWNSGMFVFRADRMLEELARHAPAILGATRHAVAAGMTEETYAAIPSAPIDKAVMERSDRVAVVPCDPGWSDVGSWHAIWELMEKDPGGNAHQGDTLAIGAKDNLIRSESRLVALAGVEGLAVIETADAILVADRSRSEAVKQIVGMLDERRRKETQVHAREVRPWGQFTVLHEGAGFKVKEVTVDPGSRLNLHYHPGRDETWMILAGAAEVELDGATIRLRPGGSLRVPRGAHHRLCNPAGEPLRLVEVGWGEALGDEDTVRIAE
ncbi:MAG: mannose-1-phosphate guanylyltransferase/mannose-6-phosphate isomerase [Geminicoccaceae bacterium]